MNEDRVYIGEAPSEKKAPDHKLTAILDGETIEISMEENQSILEALMEDGQNPPYSCMEGACMACMGKIKKGTVYQEDPGILTEDNVDENEALTCQAQPWSKEITVDYDEL